MQYMLLVYGDPAEWNVTDDELPAIYEEYAAVSRDKATKHGAQLMGTETAKTVRIRGGETLVTDGPFAETKEQLAGFYLVDAADLDEAIQIAAKIPPAREGTIEVRPVRELRP